MNSTSGQQTVYGETMTLLGVIIVNGMIGFLPNATLTSLFGMRLSSARCYLSDRPHEAAAYGVSKKGAKPGTLCIKNKIERLQN
jgi:hypothetical protein